MPGVLARLVDHAGLAASHARNAASLTRSTRHDQLAAHAAVEALHLAARSLDRMQSVRRRRHAARTKDQVPGPATALPGPTGVVRATIQQAQHEALAAYLLTQQLIGILADLMVTEFPTWQRRLTAVGDATLTAEHRLSQARICLAQLARPDAR
ncbi:hypothetical protein [Micromonospora sonneratiae]|uniref:Uncharacterized protein n=1 Tax=Micromonospora sonneratiae TaxID=1184706 RepID=A0ABW3YA22_9ACTN